MNGIGTEGYVANEMYDRINYGNNGGGLGYGNSVLAAGAHADGTAVKEAIDCGQSLQGAQLDRISAQNLEGRANDRVVLTNKNITDAEFRSLDRQRDIERMISDNAKDAALCCCETQKEMALGFAATALTAATNQSATLAAIADLKTSNIERDLTASQSRVNQLEIIAAIANNHHHHTPRP